MFGAYKQHVFGACKQHVWGACKQHVFGAYKQHVFGAHFMLHVLCNSIMLYLIYDVIKKY